MFYKQGVFMKKIFLLLFIPSFTFAAGEKFSNGEENFKAALEKIAQQYIDKGLTREDLYRAATAGMLESLNSEGKNWNTLLSPQELKDFQADFSGKTSGIGLGLKFDGATGYALVTHVLSNTPSEKAGFKREDQVLSVNGEKYKGRAFKDMVMAIRGKSGEFVTLKVLRDDKVLSLKVKREVIPWTPVELAKVDSATQLLTIGYFTGETPKLVEEKLKVVNSSDAKNLVIDLRGNAGGAFSKAVETAELFVPKDKIIVTTKDRDGKTEKYLSKKGILRNGIKILILLDKETSSGAELFAGAMMDELSAKTVGEKTFGKWNAQMIETLPNGYAVKFTTQGFQTPKGNSYQGVGIKPDVEVFLSKDIDLRLTAKFDVAKRIEVDSQLKAALELARVM